MTLADLKTGDKAIIIRVSGYGGFRKRLVEMGFIKGKVVEVLKHAPLEDPVEYAIMGYMVSLRQSEARQIEVITLEEAAHLASEQIEQKNDGTLTEEDIRLVALEHSKHIKVALVGNPNAGKTSLFNRLTGQHQRVGNYSGVTVDAKEGEYKYKDYTFTLTDLPGTYSLAAYSPEEKYVRHQLAYEHPDIVINVVDATNIERNLFLTTQLIDMNLRVVIALNMFDELQKNGDKLNVVQLSELLGINIVPTVASKGEGISNLFDTIIDLVEGGDLVDSDGKLIPQAESDTLLDRYHHSISLEHKHHQKGEKSDLTTNATYYKIHRHIHINYGKLIERCIMQLKSPLSENEDAKAIFTPRYLAIRLLEHDKEIEQYISKYHNAQEIMTLRDNLEVVIKKDYHDSAENLITDSKYGFIAGALKETYKPNTEKTISKSRTEHFDKILTNKWLGYPIFILVLFFMFQATFSWGSYPMAWIEDGIHWLAQFLREKMSAGVFKDLLIDGIIEGVGGVLVFLPNILILYLFITLMESTGYMARVAFIMDKIMHSIGLHGRSFIPLIMSFGCNVPAIMATRTIENKNSRMITILISPLISCSARLPVYLLLAGTFFPNHAGLVLFAIYMTGILLAALMARIFKRFLFSKDETPFVMELPPYRFPSIKSILRDSWEKCEQYLRKIGTTILLGSIIIWALSYFPTSKAVIDGESMTSEQRMEQQQNSYLGHIGRAIEPAMRPLGFDWKTSISLLSGVAAKEVVISTMGVLYQVDEANPEISLAQRLKSEIGPDGKPVFTPAVALSLMLFVLIYFPCIATLATIKNETNSWKWVFFTAFYTVILAWIVSFSVYQLITHNLWQEAIVALILIITIIAIIKGIRNSLRKKNKCSGCSGCDLKAHTQSSKNCSLNK